MRIVFIAPWFAEESTYIESALPRAFARLGHEVHLITSALQPNYDSPTYQRDYAPAFGDAVQPLGVSNHHGVSVHRLPHRMIAGHVSLRGLARELRKQKPDVVQTAAITSWLTYACALHAKQIGYRLFTGAHQAAELDFTTRGLARHIRLVRSAARLVRWIPGRLVSRVAEQCYAVTEDAARVAIESYGYPADKVVLLPLGFDDGWFYGPTSEQAKTKRSEVRSRLGVGEEEIVCIYTGRLSSFKNPVLLANAVEQLRSEGLAYRALFVGGGPLEAELRAIDGVIVEPFVPASRLAPFYWAADVAVWPRSYSASQIEAVACGLPLVMSDLSEKAELHDLSVRYREDDLNSLVEVLRGLSSPAVRAAVNSPARSATVSALSWNSIARTRLRDYVAARARK